MASIHRERRNGKVYYRCQFYDKNNVRKSIRLGAVNKKAADKIKAKVAALVAASIAGGGLDNETSHWLADIGEDLAAKLTNAGFGGFIPKRESATLGAFLEAYIESRKSDTADGTITNFNQVKRSLVDFFGADRDLRTITEGDADDWRQALAENYADATINKYVKRARQFFKAAVRKRFADRNPFLEVKGGSERNDERKHFVARDLVGRIINACPDAEWRLIVALARYGGVRTPSELLRVKWTDIKWDLQRFKVTSPKTKRYGKPSRMVPLFPELLPYLLDASEQRPDDAEFVIGRYRDANANLRTQFKRILDRAGVEPWPRLFQNLRASRETELANEFPLHVVTEWLGNTPMIASKHYLQVTDAHFEQAAARGDNVAADAAESGGATGGAVDGETVVQQSVPSASARCRTDANKLHHPKGLTAKNVALSSVSERNGVTPTGLEPVLPA